MIYRIVGNAIGIAFLAAMFLYPFLLLLDRYGPLTAIGAAALGPFLLSQVKK